jgi:hypothetical protein
MKLLSKIITADAQTIEGPCYFVGCNLADQTGDGHVTLYNENTSTKTAAQELCTLRVSDEFQSASMILPLPGIECTGIYADWTAGTCVVYYYR